MRIHIEQRKIMARIRITEEVMKDCTEGVFAEAMRTELAGAAKAWSLSWYGEDSRYVSPDPDLWIDAGL